ncbi:M48 family metallopeptidase [Flavobacterium sp. J27]|uniref:tetratricopeptide repeat protein n=1 Tax=Flavobacterium sp. J27 TaxID=2060419 RepID=UPI001031DC47|nr:tetratricopeptide repeat protein [Flavobacterium sp. J27]
MERQLNQKLALGPHYLLTDNDSKWQGLTGEQPIFIFNYLEIDKLLQYKIKNDIAEKANIKITSLDIIWVEGQEELLEKDILSFWLWEENGLIPFAFIGKEAHKGPFQDCEGVLFINTKSKSKKDILFYAIKNNTISKVADQYEKIPVIERSFDRNLSETIKHQGNQLFGEEKFEAAANEFFKAMYIDPTNPNPYNNIGMISQVTKKRYPRGEFFMQLSFLVDPNFTNGMRGYSGYPASNGNFEKSIEIMKNCIAIEPSIQNYIILANFYLESSNLEEGKQWYKKIKAINPDVPELKTLKKKIKELSI